MLICDIIKNAYREIVRSKLRSLLTVLGIVIGISALIAVLSVGKAGGEKISSELEKFGLNRVLFFGQDAENSLKQEDVDFLHQNLKKEAIICPQSLFETHISYNGKSIPCEISGTTPELIEIEHKELSAGRFINENDLEYKRRSIVLSYEACESFFRDPKEAVGEYVQIGKQDYEIIGVEKMTKPLFDSIFVVKSYIPITTFEKETGVNFLSEISVSASNDEKLSDIADKALALLQQNKRSELRTINMSKQAENVDEILMTFELVIASVAVISLIVGGLGIMNIMLVTITERTREIGIRKALGASDESIFLQFLMESLLYALIGGAIGVIFGAVLTAAIGRIIGLEVKLLFSAILVSVVFSIAVGLIFGILPAIRASNLDPAEAIRQD
ncbi:MAG: ABC transporter permease [Christensenellaceae bacterium]|nr:ABC transporter permease [Christensenellaceae bacterium]